MTNAQALRQAAIVAVVTNRAVTSGNDTHLNELVAKIALLTVLMWIRPLFELY